MTASFLHDILFADNLGGIVNATVDENGVITDYSLSAFGASCMDFEEAKDFGGEFA